MTPSPVSTTVLLEQLRWRCATKKFDPTRTIPADQWQALEEVLLLTPSSFGLQPWKFIIVTDRALRESLVPASWGQRQVADCSHLVIATRPTRYTPAQVETWVDRIAEVRGVARESLSGYRQMMLGTLFQSPLQAHLGEWSARQIYIALGNLMNSAALLGLDTCPMEGFETAKYDTALGLEPRGLTTVVLCPVGYRAADDAYARLPKARFKPEQIFEYR